MEVHSSISCYCFLMENLNLSKQSKIRQLTDHYFWFILCGCITLSQMWLILLEQNSIIKSFSFICPDWSSMFIILDIKNHGNFTSWSDTILVALNWENMFHSIFLTFCATCESSSHKKPGIFHIPLSSDLPGINLIH